MNEPTLFRRVVRDVEHADFMALCERHQRGEIRIIGMGTGSTNALWNVEYVEGEQHPKPKDELPGLNPS